MSLSRQSAYWINKENKRRLTKKIMATRKNEKDRSGKAAVLSTKLEKLFEDELKDIYWAEKALTKALPKMAKNASSPELVEAIETHLAETEEQVSRVEQVFDLLGKKPTAKKCEAMEGLIKEAEEFMEESDEGVMRDAAIISAAQKVEHYEIASYGTLRAFAETLGLTDIVALLEETLEEEKNADEKLTEVAVTAINLEAASEPEE
jgi:ferritin-like metal-binding protein YciE